jgi:rhodanese-related sulfurtransferase
MDKKDLEKNDGKILRVLIVITFVLIVFFVSIYVVLQFFDGSNVYYDISPEEAFELINNSASLTVVDVRGLEGVSVDEFDMGHLPGAEMNNNPEYYHNWTNDILVYSINGTVGARFCENLTGKVYGRIYNLKGGYEAWKSQDYPTTDYYIYTSSFSNIEPSEAYDLINTSSNLKVIDCRGLEGCDHCQFKQGHLPGAELNSNFLTLYNSTEDILVYSINGTVGARFCENLTGRVYGKIYNLKGGYNAWVAWVKAGFPV